MLTSLKNNKQPAHRLFYRRCLTLCTEVSQLYPEIRYYLSRVMPRGIDDGDRLGFIIDKLEEHESRRTVIQAAKQP
jgi:hypothetical protein